MFRKTSLAAVAIILSSTPALAQVAPPGTANIGHVDMQSVAQDEQAMIASIRHYIDDNGALAREVQSLRGENSQLTQELKEAKKATGPATPPPSEPEQRR